MRQATAILLNVILLIAATEAAGQTINKKFVSKKISTDLFGIFFEDLSFAADGGLYAELVQNRSFEYTASDNQQWQPLTAWDFVKEGWSYGTVSVESATPLNANNPHYVVLNVEEPADKGIGLSNRGYDGIVFKSGAKYTLSFFAKQLSGKGMPVTVELRNSKGIVSAKDSFFVNKDNWAQYQSTLTATENCDSGSLVIIAGAKGKIAFDMVSLFPEKTFNKRKNGMREDLAKTVEALHPKFMRFPGGCLVHGDGTANMYRWKNTIGPVEQRIDQRNIWNYHQSEGIGYYEYFQFCEDIHAKPVPVIAAAVSCQNSGGTWKIGGTGQRSLSIEETTVWIQDILDLIEWANGPVTSEWGAKRAAAGHPAPFNLEYVGIGNEDKITVDFKDRFKQIYDVIRRKHPEITIIGTVGPAPVGEDFSAGWKFADLLKVPVVDEHYYEQPSWFLHNVNRYDNYDRTKSKVYIGEYASWGNTLYNAICEAVYMTSLERNGDIVHMASYAPLLANTSHTSWNPNLIYFNNKAVFPTVNYYVQQLFSCNSGDTYYSNVITCKDAMTPDSLYGYSCVRDSQTGDIVLKIANAGASNTTAQIDLSIFNKLQAVAVKSILTGDRAAKNTSVQPNLVMPEVTSLPVSKKMMYSSPPFSLTVIRIKSTK